MTDRQPQLESRVDEPKPPAPDPDGPPVAVPRTEPGCSCVGTFVGVIVLGGAVATMLPVGSTCGATRSARLQWEQRQAEIQAVIDQAEACSKLLPEKGEASPGQEP